MRETSFPGDHGSQVSVCLLPEGDSVMVCVTREKTGFLASHVALSDARALAHELLRLADTITEGK